MEMTLVKPFHSGDPDMKQNAQTCKYLIIQGKELVSAIQVKASKKAYFLLFYIIDLALPVLVYV
jgi:hypothetical protein